MSKRIFKYLIFLFVCAGCSLEENNLQPENTGVTLKITGRHALQVPEPSGLTLFPPGNFLWTVSDQTGSVYQMDYSGRIYKALDINGNDLEGVCFNHFSNELLIVEEFLAEIVRLDTMGNIKGRTQILNTHDNSGLEGICIDNNGNIFVLKEKAFGLWIALNPDFSIKETIELTFASDYSGISCDTTANRFWIVSDQDKKIFLWDKNDGVIEQFNIPVENAEGIAVDFQKDQIYVVSDSQAELYILSR